MTTENSVERELTVIDHRTGESGSQTSKEHVVRDHVPKVTVFSDSTNPPPTAASIKRHRFVQNLRNNHQKLIEALAYVERFAVMCELSTARIESIRKAKDDAISELTIAFEEKLNTYDKRIKEGAE
jgi:hypothetical protein